MADNKDDCPFCEPASEVIVRNSHAFAIRDSYPVAPNHTLIIPDRHIASISELTTEEYLATFLLVRELIDRMSTECQQDGFNIGVNIGAAAGQTVMHAHIHLIPRHQGDVESPEGGIRAVIPGRQNYLK